MHKKLTITVDERVYRGLHEKIGPRRISQFIEDLVRPHVLNEDLEEQYAALAREEANDPEALEFIEAAMADIGDMDS